MAVRLSEIVGSGYDVFWEDKHFYECLKGGRGSKKSKTMALRTIYRMMAYPGANTLVVRRVYSTLKDSCFTELLWAINALGVSAYWKAKTSPLELIYYPNPSHKEIFQKILFRGMDDPQKITSIAVEQGYLCWVWIEEAYQITDESDFDKLMMSIRGKVPKSSGLFKQVTMTFNPWRENWIKTRFFDNKDDTVYTQTTTYLCNEWLDDADKKRYEDMQKNNPRAAKVSVCGEWGSAEDMIYSNWTVEDFNISYLKSRDDVKFIFGLDFGYQTSYNAFVAAAIEPMTRTIWIYSEMYEKGLTNLSIAKKITSMGFSKEPIWADAAEPKSIYELQNGLIEETTVFDRKEYVRYMLPNIRPAMKGPDSVSNGISKIQEFHMIVHPSCENMILELNNYAWAKDKDGKLTGKPEKEWDHLCDALRYAVTGELAYSHGGVVEARGTDISGEGQKQTEPVSTLSAGPEITPAEQVVEVPQTSLRKRVCRVFSSIRSD